MAVSSKLSATLCRRMFTVCCGLAVLLTADTGRAQSVGSGSIRPFVTGWTPVIDSSGRLVGGVLVDPKGVVREASEVAVRAARGAREKSLLPPPAKLARRTSHRQVSLKALDAEIDRARRAGRKLPQEVLFLGGLTRIHYLIVDRENRDLVLVGPAEPWRLSPDGDVVGRETGQPVLRLEDLVVALRCAADGGVASCSIDPTREGAEKLQKLLLLRKRVTPALKRQLERAVGPQVVTLAGVSPHSRFAHVMLAADVQMKRLAMQLESNAPERPRGYLALVHASGRPPLNAAPRWWIAPEYEPIAYSHDRSVWRITGPGFKVVSEDGFARADGSIVDLGGSSPTTAAWSEEFNAERKRLQARYPIFAELRNCIDLSVVAALIYQHRLLERAECPLPTLIDAEDVQPARLPAPRSIASVASLMPAGREVIVAVSGGVEIDGWKVAERISWDRRLPPVKELLTPRSGGGWTWD